MGLCRSKLPQTGRPLRPKEKDILKSPLIIFVMGGPGCGKGTQCKYMATKYGLCHVGLGQLLRQEAQRGTQRGRQIHDLMRQGLLVPTGIVLDMVSDNMLSHPESRGFLIDGFPRELKQAQEFERIVGRAPDAVMVFDCSMETMVRRVLRRGQVERRADDAEPAIQRRLETHYTLCEPVLTFYQRKNLLRNILAEEAPENIFAKCCSVIESL
ncbi:adenylate kinase isoenzyme 1 isoform X2 [Microcebus murinus]|uniref:adenylate kinase isoenzyme 1 isoform X2 n=1 Tax=Microcebus murinus TaxID=30608 RepID=UPI0006431DE9|nr:adenylate kinase isoenzyme 1-like isoform X2 [Microcebus murinus]